MAAALAIGVDEERAWRLARKAGWDSVPAVRSAVIHLLARYGAQVAEYAEIEEKTGLPKTPSIAWSRISSSSGSPTDARQATLRTHPGS